MWMFPRLKTWFLSFSKSKSFHVGTAHIWTILKLNTRILIISKTTPCGKALPISQPFRSLYTRFLRISKSISLLDSNAHIWTFHIQIRDYCASANRPACRMSLLIFETFEAWKSDSWEVANRPAYRTALPLFKKFTAWKRDSWASVNQRPCGTSLPISERFAARIRDCWVSGNQPHCW